MCIRDRPRGQREAPGKDAETLLPYGRGHHPGCPVRRRSEACLLYTSDAADDLLCVDLGGRRIIKKKTTHKHTETQSEYTTEKR